MYRAPHKCSICGGKLTITELSCPECSSKLTGEFDRCRFCSLSPEESAFPKPPLTRVAKQREVVRGGSRA